MRLNAQKTFWLLIVLLLAGCSGIKQAAKAAASDPSQLLYLYAVVNCTLAILLAIFSDWSLFVSILQSVRISGALCLVASPLLWIAYETPKPSIAVGATGALALVAITVIFWRYLYPKRPLPETSAEV